MLKVRAMSPRSPLPPVRTAILAALTTLFAARVAAQALQFWLPVDFLPPFDAFHGSALPYLALLAVHAAVLAAMAGVLLHLHRGTLQLRPPLARTLKWIGSAYFAVMLARLAIGLTLPAASRWFAAVIPAGFHLALAAFLIVLGGHGCESGHDASRRSPA